MATQFLRKIGASLYNRFATVEKLVPVSEIEDKPASLVIDVESQVNTPVLVRKSLVLSDGAPQTTSVIYDSSLWDDPRRVPKFISIASIQLVATETLGVNATDVSLQVQVDIGAGSFIPEVFYYNFANVPANTSVRQAQYAMNVNIPVYDFNQLGELANSTSSNLYLISSPGFRVRAVRGGGVGSQVTLNALLNLNFVF